MKCIDFSDLPWPDDCTCVFRPGEPSRALAWIPQTRWQWSRYADGYREGAERVFQSWRGLSDDSLVFPIVFLYRHYTELRIKELLLAVSTLLGIDLPKDWNKKHKIDELWRHLKPLLKQASPSEPSRDFDNVERMILEIAHRDSIATEFRYPEDKDGKRCLADLERLDVENFITAMRQLSAFLDGASMAISVELDKKWVV